MTREEEIIKKSASYEEDLYYKRNCAFNPEWFELKQAFANGARWSDENPRKGLWDSEKVCDFIKNNCIFSAANSPVIVEFDGEELVRNLRKVMED